jgi:hypothetical protein
MAFEIPIEASRLFRIAIGVVNHVNFVIDGQILQFIPAKKQTGYLGYRNPHRSRVYRGYNGHEVVVRGKEFEQQDFSCLTRFGREHADRRGFREGIAVRLADLEIKTRYAGNPFTRLSYTNGPCRRLFWIAKNTMFSMR